MAPALSLSVARTRGYRTRKAMVQTFPFEKKPGKRVRTIGPERRVLFFLVSECCSEDSQRKPPSWMHMELWEGRLWRQKWTERSGCQSPSPVVGRCACPAILRLSPGNSTGRGRVQRKWVQHEKRHVRTKSGSEPPIRQNPAKSVKIRQHRQHPAESGKIRLYPLRLYPPQAH